MNRNTDIYVRDLQTGVTKLLSANLAGTDGGNGESANPFISANGQVVTFQSYATDLLAADTNNRRDIYAFDLRTGVLSLVSVNRASTGSGNNDSFRSATLSSNFHDFSIYHILNPISADGRFTVFESNATDLVAEQDNNNFLSDKQDVFVRDLQTGTTRLVSMNQAGDGTGNYPSLYPTISANGKFVVFLSKSENLVANSRFFELQQLYVRNLETNTTTLVSVNTSGATGNYDSGVASISTDGRYIAFESTATDLIPPGLPTVGRQVYVRDMQQGVTRLVSVNSAGTGSGSDIAEQSAISASGRFVVFTSYARDLVSGVAKPYNARDVYVRDLQTGTTRMLSVSPDGAASSSGDSTRPAISADGRIVAFDAASRNLIANDPAVFPTRYNVFAAAASEHLRFNPNAYSVSEADGAATVTVARVGAAGTPLTVAYTTADGSATGGRDYTPISGTLTFAADETAKTLTIPVLEDGVNEADETINLIVANLNSTDVPGVFSTAIVTIRDNDALPSITVSDVSVTEGNTGTTNAIFTVTLSAATEQEVSIDVATQGVTASVFADFQSVASKVTIAPGRTSQTVTVQIVGDTVFEADETFTFNLSNPVNGVIADGQGSGTIINDDPLPTVSISNMSLAEGNSGTRNMIISLSLSNTSYLPVQVQYSTADGTATAGSDYTAAAGTITFNPGATFASVAVAVIGDTQVELNETFFVNLANPTNATIGNGRGTGIIVNDDGPAVHFEAAGYQVNEGEGRVTLTVTRSAGDQAAFSVDYRTTDNDTFAFGCSDTTNNRGAAFARCDFATVVGTLNFAAGEMSKQITVPIIDDVFIEGTETFRVLLLNAAGAATAAPATATVTIQDNDTAAGAPNPIFTNGFFVRQQYLDFLGREPEPAGFDAWTGVLARCPDVNNTDPHNSSAGCDRLTVTAAFFGSQEFQLKGFYVYRLYKVAFNRSPLYSEIVSDMSFVTGSTAQEVFQRRAQLPVRFTQRQEFLTNFVALSNSDYVAALLAGYQLTQISTPDPNDPDGTQKVTLTKSELTGKLNSGELTRAQVLRAIADSDQVGAAELNQAFVAMQYYGYLRRTPDTGGYNNWLNYLNTHPNDARTMVNGFVNSTEYRLRFGNPNQ